ncbi:hypothetical protein C8F04DRAFT_1273534 [Mycena alexandri]|uniref:Uncharacterized protein n=1 Tax=Mycena alexandri TaxID=1745969 RepID=A0AAD6S9D4_9AGAR|nr:hypothetical protein C8F04DRAFT_1273534 [Mycena alexandri]
MESRVAFTLVSSHIQQITRERFCLLDKIDALGTKNDEENHTKDNEGYRFNEWRRRIYEKGLAVKTKRVGILLEPESLVPTQNTFSDGLSRFGFNLLVPDFLREFELGVF